jgi:hypothetical protein
MASQISFFLIICFAIRCFKSAQIQTAKYSFLAKYSTRIFCRIFVIGQNKIFFVELLATIQTKNQEPTLHWACSFFPALCLSVCQSACLSVCLSLLFLSFLAPGLRGSFSRPRYNRRRRGRSRVTYNLASQTGGGNCARTKCLKFRNLRWRFIIVHFLLRK